MAKKDEKIDLENFDFDLEDDWGRGNSSGDPKVQDGKNDRSPVKRAGKTVLRNMGKTTFSSQMAKNILKSALPRSFTTTLDNIDRGLTDSRALFQDVKRDAGPVTRELKTLGRNLNRLIPSRYSNKLDALLKEESNGFGKGQGTINLEDLAVSKAMGDVFGNDQDTKQQKGEELAKELTEMEYRKKFGEAVYGIRDLLSQQTSYQFTVQRAYSKKSMELKIRQLMISRAQLDVTQKAAVETSNLLRSVVENTGLPDVVKLHRSEEFMRMAREKMFGKVQQSMANFTANYRQQVGQRVKNAASTKFSELTNGMSLANSSLEELENQRELLASMGVTPSEFLAGGAGNMGALWLGRKAGKFASRRMPSLGRTDSVFQGANYLFNNKERLLSDWGRSGNKHGRWFHPLVNAAKDTLRSTYKDQGVIRTGGLSGIKEGFEQYGGAGGLGGGSDPEMKDMLSGYLSRILHSIDLMRTGDSSTQRTVFNNQRGTFTTMSESVSDVRQNLLSDGQIKSQRDSIERLVNSIDTGNKLSGEAKNKIIDALFKRSRTSKAFDPSKLANENISGLKSGDLQVWQGLLATRYGLKMGQSGDWALDPFSSRNVNLNSDAGQYNYSSNQTVGLYNRAKGLASGGNLEQLIADGAVVFKNGNWELNQDYYDNRANGGSGPGSPSPAPNGPSGPPLPPTPGGPGQPPLPIPPGRRFGADWVNPENVRFNINQGKKSSDCDCFKEALETQITRLVEQHEKGYVFLGESLPRIEDQIAALRVIAASGGEGGEGGSGGGAPSGRRKWWKRALGAAGTGIAAPFKLGWKAGALPFTAARGLWNVGKKPFAALGGGLLRKGFGALGSLGGQFTEVAQDGYIRSAEGMKKAIDKTGLRSGRYVDQATGKVIKKLSDITGAVWDVVENTQVVSDDEAKQGLFNGQGERIKTTVRKLGSAVSALFNGRFTPYRLMRSAAGGAMKLLSFGLNSLPDIYVSGETKPRLYAAKLANGEYYSMKTGKRIKTLKDIDGDVGTLDPTTRTMTPVLSAEDAAKGLVDRKGKPIRTGLGKLLGMAGGLVAGAARFAMSPIRLLNAMGRTATNIATSGVRTVGNLFAGRGVGFGGGEGSWNKRIYRLLVNHFTGKNPLEGLQEEGSEGRGVLSWLKRGANRASGRFNDVKDRLSERAGSWWNRLHQTKDKKVTPKDADKAAKESGGWGKLIWLAIGGVTTVLAKIRSGFGSFFGWIKELPKWLSAKSALDGAGDLLDGADGGRRRPRSRLGRMARGLGRGAKALGRGALSVGKVALGLGGGFLGMAGRFALGAASMIGSIVTAPVALGIAAAVGAGYLIYKGYQAYSNRMTSLRDYRVAQYGIDPKIKDRAGKVLALEEAVLKDSTITVDGKLKIGSLDYPGLLSAFDVTETDTRSTLAWTRWFKMRFIPVFSRNVETLAQMDKKAKITDANFLKEGERPEFARKTFIASTGNGSPYIVSDSPFIQDSAIVGDKFVAGYRDKVISEYKTAEEQMKKSGATKVVSTGEVKSPTITETVNRKVAELGNESRAVNPATDLFYSPGDRVKTPGGITGDVQRDELIQIGNRIDDLTAIRMKIYGLGELVKEDVNTLVALEADVLKDVKYVSNGSAHYNGDMTKLFAKWAGHFTVNATDAAQKEAWLFWFEHRFLPPFLNFCAQSNKIAPNTNPTEAWRRLNSSDLLKIANFTNRATTEINSDRVSIWTVKAFPWPKRSANTDSSVINVNLDNLRDQSKKEVYQEKAKTQGEIDKMTYDGKKLNQTNVGQKIQDLMLDMSGAQAASKGRASGSGTGSYGQRMGSMGTSYEMAGSTYDYSTDNMLHTGQGTGGSINDLPQSGGDGWANNKALIAAVANMTGVDPGSLAAMIAQESNFVAKAKAGTSSASGMGQFIDSTWREILPTLVKKYGVNPNTPQTDARASVLATAEYMKQNASIIGNIGRPLTTTDIYMAHFLGPGGAKAVLSVSPDTPIQEALGDRYAKIAAANKSIFSQVRTTGDLSRVLAGYLAKNGGRFIDEANSLSKQSGGTVGASTGGGTGGSPTPAQDTPPIPDAKTGGTTFSMDDMKKGVRTGSSGQNMATAPMPLGDAGTGAVYTRSTGSSQVSVTAAGSDVRDDAARANAAAMNQEETSRVAISANRNVTATANQQQTDDASVLNQSLGVQKQMAESLVEVVELLRKAKGGVGTTGTTDSAGPVAPTTPSGYSAKAPGLQRGGSERPFNTSNQATQYK